MIDTIIKRAEKALAAKDLTGAIVGRKIIGHAITRGLYGASERHVGKHDEIYAGIGELIRNNHSTERL